MASDDLETDFTRLVGEVRAEEAVISRVRERHLRAAASAGATLGGVLLDLAEQDAPVDLRTVAGRTVRGRIVMVATDAIVIEDSEGAVSYVPLRAVSTVRTTGRHAVDAPAGDRAAPRPVTFAVLVAELAGERPQVTISVVGSPDLLTGELRAAGVDVLTVWLDADTPVSALVAYDQIAELTVTSLA